MHNFQTDGLRRNWHWQMGFFFTLIGGFHFFRNKFDMENFLQDNISSVKLLKLVFYPTIRDIHDSIFTHIQDWRTGILFTKTFTKPTLMYTRITRKLVKWKKRELFWTFIKQTSEQSIVLSISCFKYSLVVQYYGYTGTGIGLPYVYSLFVI